MSKGHLFIISGCSGVGKTTVLSRVMAGRDDLLFSVSATTRSPRPDETEAVNYYFVSRDTFQGMVERGEFMEYDEHMGNFYGTPKGQLEEKLSRGNVILDIEPNGAFIVQAQRPDATLIFIAPPSIEELEHRLRGRGDTDEEQIQKRLARVRWEMEQSPKYHHVIVNRQNQAQACADEILKAIAQRADQ